MTPEFKIRNFKHLVQPSPSLTQRLTEALKPRAPEAEQAARFVQPKMSPRFTVPSPSLTEALTEALKSRPTEAEQAARFVAPEPAPTFKPGEFGVPDQMPTFDAGRTEGAAPKSDYQKSVERYQTMRATPAVDTNGRPASAGLGALDAMSREAKSGSLARTAGAGIVGAVASLFKPNRDEEAKKDAAVAEALKDIGVEAELEDRERGGLKDLAQIEGLLADAAWKRQRPDIEAGKREDARTKAERAAVLSNLRLHKGQKLDPANPSHAALLERAANAGVEVDPDVWNGAGGNLVPITVVDPENPTRTRRQMLNKVTGEISDVGQAGYVAPRDGEGATWAERAANSDRDDARENTEAWRRVNMPLIEARIRSTNATTEKTIREMETGVTGAAKRTYDLETDTLKGRLSSIRSHRAGIQNRLKDGKLLPGDGQAQLDELDSEEREVTAQIGEARQRALSGGRSSSIPAPRFSPSPTKPNIAADVETPRPSAGKRLPRKNFNIVREDNPALRGMSDAELEAYLKRQGVEVF